MRFPVTFLRSIIKIQPWGNASRLQWSPLSRGTTAAKDPRGNNPRSTIVSAQIGDKNLRRLADIFFYPQSEIPPSRFVTQLWVGLARIDAVSRKGLVPIRLIVGHSNTFLKNFFSL